MVGDGVTMVEFRVGICPVGRSVGLGKTPDGVVLGVGITILVLFWFGSGGNKVILGNGGRVTSPPSVVLPGADVTGIDGVGVGVKSGGRVMEGRLRVGSGIKSVKSDLVLVAVEFVDELVPGSLDGSALGNRGGRVRIGPSVGSASTAVVLSLLLSLVVVPVPPAGGAKGVPRPGRSIVGKPCVWAGKPVGAPSANGASEAEEGATGFGCPILILPMGFESGLLPGSFLSAGAEASGVDPSTVGVGVCPPSVNGLPSGPT